MLLTPSIFVLFGVYLAVTAAGDDEVLEIQASVGSLRWKIVWLGAWGVAALRTSSTGSCRVQTPWRKCPRFPRVGPNSS